MDEMTATNDGLSRRDLLRRGAIVGAAAVWTVPVIQVVSMTPAAADSPSAPRGSNPSHSSGVDATSGSRPSSGTNNAGGVTDTGSGGSSGGTLPFTGASVVPTAVIGASALAVGGGILAATQAVRKRSGSPVLDTPASGPATFDSAPPASPTSEPTTD